MILRGATVGDLDLMDFREWLAICGAERASVYGSPIIQALYDSMLQYCEGDQRRPSYGAGTAAQAVVRLYGTYRHAFAFEMQSGMGEVVVVPLYRSSREQRGVKFEFFMKLKRVGLNANRDLLRNLHSTNRCVCGTENIARQSLPAQITATWNVGLMRRYGAKLSVVNNSPRRISILNLLVLPSC